MAKVTRVGNYAVETRLRPGCTYDAQYVSLWVKVQARSIVEAKSIAFRHVFAAFGPRAMPFAKSAKFLGE